MGAVATFTSGEVLTAALMNQIAQMDCYATPTSASVNPAVAGSLYIVTTSTSAITITLPAPTAGICVGIKKTDAAAGTCAVTAGSGYILGPGVPASTASIQCSAYGAYVILQGDGTNWHIVAGAQDTGWLPLPTYTNSWASNFGPATGGTVAGYRLNGDVVRLGGSIKTGTNSTAAFTLPAGARPVYLAELPMSTTGGAGNLAIVSASGVATPYASSGTTPVYIDGSFTVD